ncbi:MAG: hypothetical protein LBU79_03560 [Planctomycetota bacterium]|jgi:hypothetical protein|nr:hypothetical protein [Planctomycetota bacterium]
MPENELPKSAELDIFGNPIVEEPIEPGEGEASPGSGDVASPDAAAQPAKPPPPPPKKKITLAEALAWLFHWHSMLFLGFALLLGLVALIVYPEPKQPYIPPANNLYNDGLNRLYRSINPDLPLLGTTLLDEALAARNAFLNLFLFHGNQLRNYPEFINPHLLMAETNYRAASFNPDLAANFLVTARQLYDDALAWEQRSDSPENLQRYALNNYLASPPALDHPETGPYLKEHENEVELRRQRRDDYIRYRMAEIDIRQDHPDLAIPFLETLSNTQRSQRRNDLLATIHGEYALPEVSQGAFELGTGELARLPLLLAQANDALGQFERAQTDYLTFLANTPEGPERIIALTHLAKGAMEMGEVWRNSDPARSRQSYQTASNYYNEIANATDISGSERNYAILQSARTATALASLVPEASKTVVDAFKDAGEALVTTLEKFTSKSLPQRTLGLPAAAAKTLVSPLSVTPTPLALPEWLIGEAFAMSTGGLETAYSVRRQLLQKAVRFYDLLAAQHAGTAEGEDSAVMAANDTWDLGLKDEATRRYLALMDPLLRPETHLAARLGLANIAFQSGDLEGANHLIFGGRRHTRPLWFTPDDANWQLMATRLGNPGNRTENNVWRRIWDFLPSEAREIAYYAASGRSLDSILQGRFLKGLNAILRLNGFYDPSYFPDLEKDANLEYLLAKHPETRTSEDVVWLNRLVLEESWPYDLTQKGKESNIVFLPFPPGIDLDPSGLTPPRALANLATRLARGWAASANDTSDLPERMRLLLNSSDAYNAAIDSYQADQGELLPELAGIYERQADTREGQSRHRDALSLTAQAGRTYLAVSSRARGSPREMDSLLAAADAFFRSGLLERTIESLNLFIERFAYTAPPSSEISMSVAVAENLLGRAYWFLGDYPQAAVSFNRNIKRRTPERFKSVYYLGRLMLEEGRIPGADTGSLGDPAIPLPELDADGDPLVKSALQAFNYIRQHQSINPTARAWRWSTFDAGHLAFSMAENARLAAESVPAPATPDPPDATAAPLPAWLSRYEEARQALTEALERYPLRLNGNGGPGLSVRVEPEDYADLMASRLETEYVLAKTLLRLADAHGDEELYALARAHFSNISNPDRYADALFDTSLDRFQLNSAVIREEVERGNWNTGVPLPRTRLGDDEGLTHSPTYLQGLLRNSMFLLAQESYRAAERVSAQDNAAAQGLYRQSYDTYQSIYDRFGLADGPQAMLGMADVLNRLGLDEAADNHYRLAENIARLQDPAMSSDGLLQIGPEFWGKQANWRLQDKSFRGNP